MSAVYAAIGAGVMVAGTYIGGKQEQAALKKGIQSVGRMTEESKVAAGMADPFAGYRAKYAQRLDGILSGTEDFKSDPGYQFVYDEAMRGTQRTANAGGYAGSGNVQRALQATGAGIASQEYDKIINRLTNLSGASSANAQTAGGIYGNQLGTATNAYTDLYGSKATAKKGMSSEIGSTIGKLISGA
jgi:hypothetical protein